MCDHGCMYVCMYVCGWGGYVGIMTGQGGLAAVKDIEEVVRQHVMRIEEQKTQEGDNDGRKGI